MILIQQRLELARITFARHLKAGGNLVHGRYMSSKSISKLLKENEHDKETSKKNYIENYGVRTTRFSKGKANPARYLRRSFVPKNVPGDGSLNAVSATVKFDNEIMKTLPVRQCTTVTTCESYDLKKCLELLNHNGMRPVNLIAGEIVAFKYRCNGIEGDIMILGQTGSVVCWGFDEKIVIEKITPLIQVASINPLIVEDYESEDMDYAELTTFEEQETMRNNLNISQDFNADSLLIGDIILINSIDPALGILDKAAFSSGLSRSTSLAILENEMEKHISNTRIITEKISRGLKLNVKESDALKSIGKLFLIRGRLNLYSELIETPDLYWSEPKLEVIYKNVSRYLDISPRINILNSKLDYSTDECRAILSLLNERNSSFLEWIIIYLITFEVCFELFHFYRDYKKEQRKNIESL